ncbi:MAG: hypothetical protein HQ575_00825 [Candidatus Omnitrophica bacterium]|nr:hypothetical protein [Candidatus Omnitrophota bacterium]
MGLVKRGIVIFLVISVSLAGRAWAGENMDRIRAVEALYLLMVEQQFFSASAPVSLEDLRAPLDQDLIASSVVASLSGDGLDKGRLWVHKSFWRAFSKWDRFNGRIGSERVIRYEDTEELLAQVDPECDMIIMARKDLLALARDLSRDKGVLDEAVIISPLDIRLEFVDHCIVSMVLMKDVRRMLESQAKSVVVSLPEFRALHAILESLFARRSGFNDGDILRMVPHNGLSFEARALTILQGSMAPIRQEDLRRIRKIQTTLIGV